MQTFLAIDIGASSGRHILGQVKNGRLRTREIYRFPNGTIRRGDHLCWDLKSLWGHILQGMRCCREQGVVPDSVGIDTWGVDFVLLDQDGRPFGDAVAYRDGRTAGMDAEVAKVIRDASLYERTGIQKLSFNTIYQLTALKNQAPQTLREAKRFLMIPDYFHYRLSGVAKNEYTNATTTALVKAGTTDWDRELIAQLGFSENIFGEIVMPGTELGTLLPEVQQQVGFNCRVVLPATHDTGSAVLAVPAEGNNFLYISSGTWSLLGTESLEPCCTPAARAANFTNEGGYEKRFRFLRNIMGSWMIQSVRNESGKKQSFDELCDLARQAEDFPSLLDVNDPSFLAPQSMTEAVAAYCVRTGQKIPQTLGETMSCIYLSLAKSYAETIEQLKEVTGRTFDRLHIVGGGSKDSYLNELTARAAGLPVFAGPTEATAIGNLLAQMLHAGLFHSVEEARACVQNSFPVSKIMPDERKETL
jgi:rhamnulokinase